MKKVFRSTLLFLILGLFLFYFLNNKDDFFKLSEVNFSFILIILILRGFQIFLNGILLKQLIDPIIHSTISLKEAFYISSFSAVGNFLSFLQGGVIARGVYLNEKYNLSISRFTGSIIYNYAILFLVFGLIATVSLLSLEADSIIISFALIFSFSGILIIFFWSQTKNVLKTFFSSNKMFNKLSEAIEETNNAYLNVRTISILVTLIFVRFVIASIINLLIFMSINKYISTLGLFLYTAITGLSVIINLTPGSLGFREGLLIIFKNSLDLSNLEIIEAAVVDRVLLVIVLLLLFLLTRRFRSKDEFQN